MAIIRNIVLTLNILGLISAILMIIGGFFITIPCSDDSTKKCRATGLAWAGLFAGLIPALTIIALMTQNCPVQLYA